MASSMTALGTTRSTTMHLPPPSSPPPPPLTMMLRSVQTKSLSMAPTTHGHGPPPGYWSKERVWPCSAAALTESIATSGWWHTFTKICCPRLARCAEMTKPASGVITTSRKLYWKLLRSSSTLPKFCPVALAASATGFTVTLIALSKLLCSESLVSSSPLSRPAATAPDRLFSPAEMNDIAASREEEPRRPLLLLLPLLSALLPLLLAGVDAASFVAAMMAAAEAALKLARPMFCLELDTLPRMGLRSLSRVDNCRGSSAPPPAPWLLLPLLWLSVLGYAPSTSEGWVVICASA